MTQALAQAIRDVPDFPKPGILFKDITTLLADPAALRQSIDALVHHYRNGYVQKVVGMESRGFIFGAPVAYALGAGFVPVRKPGKLPAATHRIEYDLEYGTDALEIHQDAIEEGERVLIIDDLLATGGTALATAELVERVGGEVIGCGFLIELAFLAGRQRLEPREITSLIVYE